MTKKEKMMELLVKGCEDLEKDADWQFHVDKVMARCPACGKKHHVHDVMETFLPVKLAVFSGPGAVTPSADMFVCLVCGTVFFPPASLARIKGNVASGDKLIVDPRAVGGMPRMAS